MNQRVNNLRIKRILLWILFAAVFYATHCERKYRLVIEDGEETNTLIIGDTLTIKYRQTLYNHDENIWMTFDSLISDSRCPIGMRCFWEGNAEVSFVFDSIRFNLNTFGAFTNDTIIQGYYIGLIHVWPYPDRDSLYAVDEYSADILILKETL